MSPSHVSVSIRWSRVQIRGPHGRGQCATMRPGAIEPRVTARFESARRTPPLHCGPPAPIASRCRWFTDRSRSSPHPWSRAWAVPAIDVDPPGGRPRASERLEPLDEGLLGPPADSGVWVPGDIGGPHRALREGALDPTGHLSVRSRCGTAAIGSTWTRASCGTAEQGLVVGVACRGSGHH